MQNLFFTAGEPNKTKQLKTLAVNPSNTPMTLAKVKITDTGTKE